MMVGKQRCECTLCARAAEALTAARVLQGSRTAIAASGRRRAPADVASKVGGGSRVKLTRATIEMRALQLPRVFH